MKISRSAIALAAITATALSSALIPTAAIARPALGNQLANFEDQDNLGVRTLTVVDQQTLLPGKTFAVRVLFTKDRNRKVFPKFTGVGFDKELWNAIDHGTATAKQFTTASEIKENFPESKLAQLPSGVKNAIDNGSWKLNSRNKQSTGEIEFASRQFFPGFTPESYYVSVKDADYSTDQEGLGDSGIIAMEFTFTTKTSAPSLNGVHIGAYMEDPDNFLVIPQHEQNWDHLLSPVAVDVRQEADVEILTPSGEHAPGESVTLKAHVTPSQYQGNVTFNIGGEIKEAAVINQVASTEYVMGEQPVTVLAEINANEDFSAAISDYVRFTPQAPKKKEEETTSPNQPPTEPGNNGEDNTPEPSPNPPTTDNTTKQPSTAPAETSSVGDYWWAILLAVLGVLGIGGGAFAWSNGLIR